MINQKIWKTSSMNFYSNFKKDLSRAIHDYVDNDIQNNEELKLDSISVDPPREETHGDISTNAAMVLTKQLRQNPRILAQAISDQLDQHPDIEKKEIAGPGFINIWMKKQFWHGQLKQILAAENIYGQSSIGESKPVNIEYVSANPTGHLHIGHVRGAIFGDALAKLLSWAGFDVTKEYYINDAGNQVQILARSTYLRYCEAAGKDIGEIPEGYYPGEYLIPIGQSLFSKYKEKWLNKPEEEWLELFQKEAIEAMMTLIKLDMKSLGIEHDVFTSEKKIISSHSLESMIDDLKNKDLIYEGVLPKPKSAKVEEWESRPQTLFRSSQYGDDTDRALKKADGSWTYFATDMAYHYDKFQRGFKDMINVWGADHGGYVKRLNSAIHAMCGESAELDVKLCQMVRVVENGEVLRMSKRAGSFVTLKDLLSFVDKDSIRFMMLMRKNDQHLDFDLGKVKEQSKDNPIFYVQYAHARCCSVFRYAQEDVPEISLEMKSLKEADLSYLVDETEINLIKKMSTWPRILESAALAHEPHRIAFYLYELASVFHSLWNKGKGDTKLRFLYPQDKALTTARLALLMGLKNVLVCGLSVLSVEPLESMH